MRKDGSRWLMKAPAPGWNTEHADTSYKVRVSIRVSIRVRVFFQFSIFFPARDWAHLWISHQSNRRGRCTKQPWAAKHTAVHQPLLESCSSAVRSGTSQPMHITDCRASSSEGTLFVPAGDQGFLVYVSWHVAHRKLHLCKTSGRYFWAFSAQTKEGFRKTSLHPSSTWRSL